MSPPPVTVNGTGNVPTSVTIDKVPYRVPGNRGVAVTLTLQELIEDPLVHAPL